LDRFGSIFSDRDFIIMACGQNFRIELMMVSQVDKKTTWFYEV
jgi:hypothetical protein